MTISVLIPFSLSWNMSRLKIPANFKKIISHHFESNLYPSIQQKLHVCGIYNIAIKELNQYLQLEREYRRDHGIGANNHATCVDNARSYDNGVDAKLNNLESSICKSHQGRVLTKVQDGEMESQPTEVDFHREFNIQCHDSNSSCRRRSDIWTKELKVMLQDSLKREIPMEIIMQRTGLTRKQILHFKRRQQEMKQPVTLEAKKMIYEAVKERTVFSKEYYKELKECTKLSMSQIYRLVHFFRNSTQDKKSLSEEDKEQVRQFILEFRTDSIVGKRNIKEMKVRKGSSTFGSSDSSLQTEMYLEQESSKSNGIKLDSQSTKLHWSRELWVRIRNRFPNIDPFHLYRFANRFVNVPTPHRKVKRHRYIRTKQLLRLHVEELKTILSLDKLPSLEERKEICKRMHCQMSQLMRALEHLSDQLIMQTDQKNLFYTYLQHHNFPSSLNMEHIKELKVKTNLSKRQILKLFHQFKFQKKSISELQKKEIEAWYASSQKNEIESVSELAQRLKVTTSQIYQQIYILHDPNGVLTLEKKKLLEEWAQNHEKIDETSDAVKLLAEHLNLSTRQVRRQLHRYRFVRHELTEDKKRKIREWLQKNDFRKPTASEYIELATACNLNRNQIYYQIRKYME